MTTSISPSLRQALNAVKPGQLSYLESSDTYGTRQFFMQRALSACRERKKILVLIPPGMPMEVVKDLLQEANLLHYSCFTERSSPSDSDQRKHIRMMSRYVVTHSTSADLQDLELKEKELFYRISQCLSLLRTELMSGHNIRDLAVNRTATEENCQLPGVESIDDKLLVRLATNFNSRFLFMMESSKLNNSVFSSDNEDLKKDLTDWTLRLKKHIDKYDRDVFQLENEIYSAIQKEKNCLIQLARKIEDLLLDPDLRHIKTNHAEVWNELKNYSSSARYLLSSINPENGSASENLRTVHTDIQNLIEQADFIKFSAAQNYFNKLTPFNTPKDSLTHAIKSIINIFKELRNDQRLELKIPSHIFQCTKIITLANELKAQLQLALEELKDENYLLFRQILNDSGVNGIQLGKLMDYTPDKWKLIVETSRSEKYLTGFDITEIESLASKMEDYISLKKSAFQADLRNLHLKLSIEKKNLIESLFKSNEIFMNFIAGADNENLPENEFEQFSKEYGEIFHLFIYHETDFPKCINSIPVTFDEVLFLELKSWDNSYSKHFDKEKTALCIASCSSVLFPKNQTKHDWTLNHNYCNELSLDEFISLKKDKKSEKYQGTLALASNLIQLTEKFSVFQTSSYSIISFLSDSLEAAIVDMLSESDLNVLTQNCHELSDLVEGILAESDETVMLVENDLINMNSLDSLERQIELIQLMESKGIKIIDIRSGELIRQGKEYLRGLIAPLHSKKAIKSRNRSQDLVNQI